MTTQSTEIGRFIKKYVLSQFLIFADEQQQHVQKCENIVIVIFKTSSFLLKTFPFHSVQDGWTLQLEDLMQFCLSDDAIPYNLKYKKILQNEISIIVKFLFALILSCQHQNQGKIMVGNLIIRVISGTIKVNIHLAALAAAADKGGRVGWSTKEFMQLTRWMQM